MIIRLRVKSYEESVRDLRVQGPPHVAAARAIREAQKLLKAKLHRRRIAAVTVRLGEILGIGERE